MRKPDLTITDLAARGIEHMTADCRRATLADGSVYRLSKWDDDRWMHVADGPSARDLAAAHEENALRDLARSLRWQDFVCAYIARKTRRPVDGYAVRGNPGAWSLCYASSPMIDRRDASTVYGWFERNLSLRPLAQAADAFRLAVLSGGNA